MKRTLFLNTMNYFTGRTKDYERVLFVTEKALGLITH